LRRIIAPNPTLLPGKRPSQHFPGADVMKRIAAPMVGGVVTSTILELVIYSAIYMIWRGREFKGQ
jgi:Cu/Ag efflux pump CusA